MSNNNQPLYRVRICNDNRLTILLHEFNLNKKKSKLPVRNKTNAILSNMYMSCSDYSKLLKRTHRKLWEREFNEKNCVFITLTLKGDLGYHMLSDQFHRFLVSLKRKFGKFEYLRTVELQATTKCYHIHTIIQFESNPTQINKKMIEKLWGLGICDVKPVYNIRGAIQYITKFKEQHIQQENRHFTCFRKGTKVITSSQHFGTPINCDNYRDTYITHEQFKEIFKHHYNAFDNGIGDFVRIDSHLYYDHSSLETKWCWDRVFIQTTKDYIDKNLSSLCEINKPP